MPSKGKVQSILFRKDKWTLESAEKWLVEHQHTPHKLDKRGNFFRYRQLPASDFDHFRTKKIDDGINFIIGYPEKQSKSTGKGIIDNIKSAFKGVDMHSLLLKINPFSTTGIAGELHFYVPGLMEKAASFMGPGTDLSQRLNSDGTPKSWSEPINNIDAACFVHNIAYNSADKTSNPDYIHQLKLEADSKLLEDVSLINTSRFS